MNNEPVAIRYDFDGYGYQYIDSGSGSDWQTRVQGEPLYTHPHPDNLGLAESIIKQQKLEIDALHNLVKEQDKKIIDLAFEKVYAERSAEVLSELYTAPPQRKPLSDEEMKKIWYAMQNLMGWYSFQEIARAIEATHGIKELV